MHFFLCSLSFSLSASFIPTLCFLRTTTSSCQDHLQETQKLPFISLTAMSSSKRRFNSVHLQEAAEDLLNHVVKVKENMGWISLLFPLIFIAWAIHTWLFSFSNWLSLALALWASMQVRNSSLSFFILLLRIPLKIVFHV